MPPNPNELDKIFLYFLLDLLAQDQIQMYPHQGFKLMVEHLLILNSQY